jgi:FKBP-type peptidyl-prolyl cis-trans isomerase FklB
MMKYFGIFAAVLACLVLLAGCSTNKTGGSTALSTKKDSISYMVGMNIGKNIKEQKIDVDADVLARGFSDAYSGGKCQLTDQQAQKVMASLQQEMMQKQQAGQKATSDSNLAAGQKYRDEYAKQAGVVKLPDGILYKVITAGHGPKPAKTQTVTVNYSGTLVDGTEFDSSFKRGQPATFPLDHVIPGWTEVVQLMPVGSRWEVVIPPELAYGPNGAGSQIGPNCTLRFIIELVSIK